jgi:hypothetical protein
LRANRAAYERLGLAYRVLMSVSRRDPRPPKVAARVILRDGAGEGPAAVPLVSGGRLEEVSASAVMLETGVAPF